MFDVGSAITVKTLVPLSCYWTIIAVFFWGVLTVTAPAGYRVIGTEYLARHLYFNIIEVAVLCMQLVGFVSLRAKNKSDQVPFLVVRLHPRLAGVRIYTQCSP